MEKKKKVTSRRIDLDRCHKIEPWDLQGTYSIISQSFNPHQYNELYPYKLPKLTILFLIELKVDFVNLDRTLQIRIQDTILLLKTFLFLLMALFYYKASLLNQ